jgi:hypothetical protein
MVGDDRERLEGRPRQPTRLDLLALQMGREVGRGAQRISIAPALHVHPSRAVILDQLVQQLPSVQATGQVGLDGHRLERSIGGEQQRLDDPLGQLAAHRLRRM